MFGKLAAVLLAAAALGCEATKTAAVPNWAPLLPIPAPPENPTSAAKIELGRHLFYDTRLSVNEGRSCGICHEQAKGFTDGFPRSIGTTGELHFHNAPSLTNVAHRAALTWNNPANQSLEVQLLTPLIGTHPLEMGMAGKRDELPQTLAAIPVYQRLWKQAFPTKASFSLTDIQFALAAFERTLISRDAPFDRYRKGEQGALSPIAQEGLQLFFSDRAGCSACHNGPDLDRPAEAPLGSPGYHNVGLYNLDGKGAYPADAIGLAAMSKRPEDTGKFRTPTLRNVAVTGPYFHDGSVSGLNAAIRVHLDGGRNVAQGPRQGDGRTSPLRSPLLKPRTLSSHELWALEAFLRSLTDDAFLTNPAFANPWVP